MRKRANGEIEFHHSMLAATLVAPGHAMVLPLMPKFIANPDGAEKQDCVRYPPSAGWPRTAAAGAATAYPSRRRSLMTTLINSKPAAKIEKQMGL